MCNKTQWRQCTIHVVARQERHIVMMMMIIMMIMMMIIIITTMRFAEPAVPFQRVNLVILLLHI